MAFVTSRIENRIAQISINRAEKRNALNQQVVSELKDAFTLLSSNEKVKVIILKSDGEVFSAGADLDYLQTLQKNTPEENLDDSNNLKELFRTIYECPKVVIAQVQGHAIAGGSGLVSVCDFAFSAPHAQFGYTEVKIGFVPAIVALFLIRKVGESIAKELLLTGNLISAQSALQIGFIHTIAEKEDLESKVLDFAQNIANSTSANSIAITKQLINNLPTLDFRQALVYAAEINAKTRSTDDFQKGINAFLTKQKLKW